MKTVRWEMKDITVVEEITIITKSSAEEIIHSVKPNKGRATSW
jgi:hypothetical protein